MRRATTARALGVLVASVLAAGVAHAEDIEPRVIGAVGFVGSEAARHDVAADRYLVSNLNTRGPANDGFISILGPDLSVRELKWIEGGRDGVELHEPLGFMIHGDTLYVADLGAVRLFDRDSGAPKGAIPVEGSVRLNDIAVDAEGTLYVTDSGNETTPGALYRITPDGQVSEFAARSPELQRPNGVAVTRDGLIVHGGLGGATLVFRDAAGQVVRTRDLPTGRIDGIVALPDGRLLVASQDGRLVYRLADQGETPPEVVARDIAVPAAIGADVQRRRLLVPQIAAATVTVVDLP